MITYDYARNQWLDISNYPFSGQPWVSTYLQYFNIHWTGSTSSVLPSTVSKEKQILNGIQKDYVEKRGYSFGYSSAVGLSGSTYEGRGTQYRAASNGDKSEIDDDLPNNPQLLDNLEVFSCLLIMGIPDNITQAMIAGVQRLYTSVCTELDRELTINGHNDLDHTGCPGPQAQNLVDSNGFYPAPILGEDDMKVLAAPKRVIDTRYLDYEINGLINKAGNPVGPGKFTFNLKTASNITQVEATVTVIPKNPDGGFVGVNKEDSFINWVSSQREVPIPQTITLPIQDGRTDLYFTDPVDLLVSVRAEG